MADDNGTLLCCIGPWQIRHSPRGRGRVSDKEGACCTNGLRLNC